MLRPSVTFAGLCAALLLSTSVFALSLSDLSQSDATGSLKDALTQDAQIAVKQLGTPGGFSNNKDVRIAAKKPLIIERKQNKYQRLVGDLRKDRAIGLWLI
jgi:hypothetical protein